MIDCEYIVCEIIKDQKVEYCEIIEDKKVEYCKITEDQKVEIIEDQKVEDINMLKSSVIEFDTIRKVDLTEHELRVITVLRGVKNYENLSKSSLIKQINKIELSEESKKIKKNPEIDTKKSFRLKKDNIKNKRGNIEFKLRKEGKKLLEIKKMLKIYY